MKKLEQLGISPSPWKHTPADEYTHAGIDDANGRGVGETYEIAGKDETAETANARLIAAAPKLYAACYEMLRYYYEQNTNTTVFNTALEMMKQSVAEAAGDSLLKEEDAGPVPASPNICDRANLVIREFEKVATRRPDGLTVIDCECSRLECAVEELKEALGEASCERKLRA